MSRWIHSLVLVLLLSVSTQALSVVFDSHAAHQESTSHLSEPSHEAPHSEQAIAQDKNSDSSGLDCQHCCHCHGAQHIFLPLLIKALPVNGHYAVRHNLNQPPATGFWRNLLRPPSA